MKDKFNMIREDNLDYAKRNLVDSIWKTANIEGILATFPQTQAILDGLSVDGLKMDEQNQILNLRDAWYFAFDHIEYPLDLNFISKINQEVGERKQIINAGVLRTYSVKMGGTSWIPEIPDSEQVKEELNQILNEDISVTERAINLMAWCCKKQLFRDGNKRTATIITNKYLIENGRGILAIPQNFKIEFGEKLIAYYETNDIRPLKQFLYDKCLDGIAYQND